MGSGTSKPKTVPEKSATKSSEKENNAVTNVNNKSPARRKDNVIISASPVKNSNSNSRKQTSKSPKKSKKSKDSDWNSDSDFEDDLDQFIKETVSHAAKTNSSHTNNEDPASSRPRTSHGRANSRPENAYPETYAQKHTREQYTVEREMLIRQKTIYRNPDEWNDESDNESEDNHGGFDASKFRKVNSHQAPKPESIVTKEFETPRYLTSQENRKESVYGIYEKEREKKDYSRRISKIPTYDLDEQRLLADLENEF